MTTRVPLGQLLVDAGLLAQEALDAVLRDQAKDGRRIGEMLVARGLVTDAQLTQILSHQLALPWVSLSKVDVDDDLLALVPRALAARHHIVPVYLRREGGRSILYVATDDPTDAAALRECAEAARMDVRPMVAASDDLLAAIDAWYGKSARPAPASVSPGAPSAGAMRVAASALPSPGSDRAVAPPIPKPAQLPTRAVVDDEIELPDEDVVPFVSEPPGRALRPVVLVVAAPLKFVRTCRKAAEAIDARVEKSDLASVGPRARELSPFAIVVTEDVYAFDRLGLSKLAIETDALLVIWSDDLEAEYLEPLLDTAHKRRFARRHQGA